ncbi:HAD hydrolase, family IA, variant 3 [Dictyocaulus viviparus]|uniref:HAD hydrolase, family IA, variant 3 n=1 Tax=Dictyocaulus viviparus TaxID=29172 RepID=A0A0D8XD92_DICVI|nr:HAD hydrolase, family IA, variant 3 [Dictyocaulus viviparus]
MGRKEVEAIPWLLNEVGIAHMVTATEYITQYDAILAEIFLKCKAMPGAERLVRHFHKKGIPQAICSGSRSITFGPKREPHKEWLDFITLKKKPDDPSKVLVFEDSPNGGRSAKAAGMKCVMVPNEKFFKEALDIGLVFSRLRS